MKKVSNSSILTSPTFYSESTALFWKHTPFFAEFAFKIKNTSVSKLQSGEDSTLENDFNLLDFEEVNVNLTEEPKSKPKSKSKKKNKPAPEKIFNTDSFKTETISVEEANNSLGNESFFKSKRSIKNEKQEIIDKAKSAKKTRIKNKFMRALYVINKVANMRIPVSLYTSIKKAKLEMLELDDPQQIRVLEVGSQLSPEELAILLLIIPEKAEEIVFLRQTVLTKSWVDLLFRNINYKHVVLEEKVKTKEKE